MTSHLGVDLGGTNFRIAAFGTGLVPEAANGPVTLGVGIAALLVAAAVAISERLSVVLAELGDDAGLVGAAARALARVIR